ncbi:hypothetical protein EVAR_61639_1 [Eumeta japonica]|uniref:Uncharacterized protein n=1 Tax=Eumeta variegata TaxID=151549 RepID=A0A4C1Z9D3_EUMVA|nr:hypothetical protein EVAR_61639_1 [Eumeta japonica]
MTLGYLCYCKCEKYLFACSSSVWRWVTFVDRKSGTMYVIKCMNTGKLSLPTSNAKAEIRGRPRDRYWNSTAGPNRNRPGRSGSGRIPDGIGIGIVNSSPRREADVSICANANALMLQVYCTAYANDASAIARRAQAALGTFPEGGPGTNSSPYMLSTEAYSPTDLLLRVHGHGSEAKKTNQTSREIAELSNESADSDRLCDIRRGFRNSGAGSLWKSIGWTIFFEASSATLALVSAAVGSRPVPILSLRPTNERRRKKKKNRARAHRNAFLKSNLGA